MCPVDEVDAQVIGCLQTPAERAADEADEHARDDRRNADVYRTAHGIVGQIGTCCRCGHRAVRVNPCGRRSSLPRRCTSNRSPSPQDSRGPQSRRSLFALPGSDLSGCTSPAGRRAVLRSADGRPAHGYRRDAALRAFLEPRDAERSWPYTPRGYKVSSMTEVNSQFHAHVDHGEHAAEHGHAGHGRHGDHVAQFRRLFWIMLVLAVPTVALSGMFAMILGYRLPDVPWLDWFSPVLGTVMYAWGGRPFLSGAVSEIRSRAPGMMLLIGLAITVAFGSSWGASLGVLDHELDFWWELALLIVIMLLGHWIEMRSLAQTTSALDSLAALLPDEAERVVGDGGNNTEIVPPSELRVGDVVVVRPGGSVPADGQIVDGSADVDESMVTGESRPVLRGVGDQVVAGTVATDSGLRVAVTAVGDDTTLAGIRRLVTEAQNSSSRAQRLADKAAGWLFWFALSAGIVTAVVWGLLGQPQEAVVRTITVLVIACPHALGLAIPLVVSIATERAARGGVLIKDRLALESMRTVGVGLLDN